MNELQQLRLRLLDELLSLLTPAGFSKKSGQDLYRDTVQGRDIFHLTFVNHPGIDFDVSVDIAVRNGKIEKLIDQVGLVPANERRGTATIGVDVGNLSKGHTLRWKIASQRDVSPIAHDLYTIFQQIALPYYQQFSNIEAIYKICSQDDPQAMLHCPINAKRAINAVCAAYLIGLNREYDALVKRKQDFLTRRDKRNMAEFLHIVENLNFMRRMREETSVNNSH